MSIPLYGIWLDAYGRWFIGEGGQRFQTIDVDRVLDQYNELQRQGIRDIEVREIMQLPQGRDQDNSAVNL